MKNLNSTKNRVFLSLVVPSETGKSQLNCIWIKIGMFQPKFFFINAHKDLKMLSKKIDNLEFVQGLIFEFLEDSLENNGTKYLIVFDNSCAQICNSKGFVDIATAGSHRAVSTFNIRHKLFHQSKLGRDAELQNTHIVFFKSTRDVLQVSTLSAQLKIGCELVDWYRDAKSVPYGNLLVYLPPRTPDR